MVWTDNYPGSADGVFFSYTGDGGSGADYRMYSVDRPISYQVNSVDPLDAAGLYASNYIGGGGRPQQHHSVLPREHQPPGGYGSPSRPACHVPGADVDR